MEQLSRTVSAESTRSWTPHLLASGSSSSAASQKARSLEPETGGATVERCSVSMPPPASMAVPRQFPSRRPSKASDSSPFSSSSAPRYGSAIDDTDTVTPTLEAAREGAAAASALTLPDAHRQPRSDGDGESNRMSFSSLYSIGSAIFPNTRGMSGPGSVAGSEAEGMSCGRLYPAADAMS